MRTQVSENLLSLYLDEYDETPWEALKFLVAAINYGGHVTDDWDRRLLNTYITDYFNEDAVAQPFYKYLAVSRDINLLLLIIFYSPVSE